MAKNVGIVTVSVTDRSDEDRAQFHAELSGADYTKCGLREFSGMGGFEHIYADADTSEEAVAEIVSMLKALGLTGSVRVAS